MVEEKMCGVCGTNEASVACSECGIPLCSNCVREVIIEEVNPGASLKGMTITAMRPARQKKKVCEKCMKEVDFL